MIISTLKKLFGKQDALNISGEVDGNWVTLDIKNSHQTFLQETGENVAQFSSELASVDGLLGQDNNWTCDPETLVVTWEFDDGTRATAKYCALFSYMDSIEDLMWLGKSTILQNETAASIAVRESAKIRQSQLFSIAHLNGINKMLMWRIASTLATLSGYDAVTRMSAGSGMSYIFAVSNLQKIEAT